MLENLVTEIDKIDIRIKKLEHEVAQKKKEAIEKGKKGDKRGAVTALKTSKMKDAEIIKNEGMKLMMEQQRVQIESSSIDKSVFQVLQESNKVLKQQQESASADAFYELKEEMEDQQNLMQEKQEFFAQAHEEDQDELMKELEDLVADDVEAQMQEVGPSSVPIIANTDANPVAAQAAQAQPSQSEADELAQLMA